MGRRTAIALAVCLGLAATAVAGDVATLRPSRATRLLVVAPHPDDETLAAGGLIRRLTARGLRVDVVFLTDGDGYPEAVGLPPGAHSAATAGDFRALGARRRGEALAATARLGVPPDHVHFLGFPDGGLAELWSAHWATPYRSPYTLRSAPAERGERRVYDGTDLVATLVRLLERLQPTLVLAPHPADTHADHRHASYFVTEALEKAHANALLDADVDVLTYLIHDHVWPPAATTVRRLPAPPLADTRWLELRLTPAERWAKDAALAAHASQLAVMPELMRKFLRPNELYGRLAPTLTARIAATH